MPLINQRGRYKSDSNVTGAIGPTFQCIFNIFLFSNIYHVKNFLRQTGYVSLPNLSPLKGHIKELFTCPFLKRQDSRYIPTLPPHRHPSPSQLGRSMTVGRKSQISNSESRKIFEIKSTFTPPAWRLRRWRVAERTADFTVQRAPNVISGERRVACRKSVSIGPRNKRPTLFFFRGEEKLITVECQRESAKNSEPLLNIL